MFSNNFNDFNDLDDYFNDNSNINKNFRIISFDSIDKNDNDYSPYLGESPFDLNNERNDSSKIFEDTLYIQKNSLESSSSFNFKNLNIVPQPEEKATPIDQKTNTTVDKLQLSRGFSKIVTKEKIFNIKKVKKHLRNGYGNENSNTHTRNSKDNIIIKIKRALYNHSLKYINKRMKKSPNPALRSLRLLKVKNLVFLVHKKEENLALLKMDLQGIFYNDISSKYLNINSGHNIKTIEKILKVNDKEMNAILKTLFEEIINIYTGKIKNEFFKDFPTIDDDIEVFKQKGMDDNYIEKYKYIAENFKQEINKVYPRRKRRII